MKPIRRLLPLFLLATPALAEAPPAALLPNRDVSVVYRLTGDAGAAIPGGVPGNLRVAWRASDRRLRVEPEGRRQVVLVDLGAPSAQLVDMGLRAAMPLPVRSRDLQPLTLEGAHLTRRGQDTVAGLSCTDYAVQSSRGRGTVCLTQDGVALRASGEVDGRQGSFIAVSVSYDPVPASSFEVPRGYVQLPMLSGGRPR